MRIQVVSDLHNEAVRHYSGEPPPPLPDAGADVLVLAGDIDNGTEGLRWAAEQSQRLDIPCLYVAGNHEFYGHQYPGLLDALRDEAYGTGVRVLERDAVVLGGVRFLGATLWTDFAGDGRFPPSRVMPAVGQHMPDYRCIQINGDEEPLTPEMTRASHRETRAWLYNELTAPSAQPTVVVTHAAPLLDCAHPEYGLNEVSTAFVSDLHPLLAEGAPSAWIYGHTHANVDLYHCGVHVLSNQRGYPDETVPGAPFDPTRVIEIDSA